MRKRGEIEKDGTRLEILLLEVLLDIRDLLQEGKVIPKTRKLRGRPKKAKRGIKNEGNMP